ncbi:MAG TPA: carbohydrate-binding family 9-like protein [Chitinophagaceae bacterium]|jgi:hypothetical protein
MKRLEACTLKSVNKKSLIGEIAIALDECIQNPIEIVPWPSYPYKPAVSFVIAHDYERIFIKYYVREQAIRAAYNNPNDPVFKDSCVEFFIAFGEEKAYYNFEFNCIGTCLSAFGDGIDNRQFLSKETIDKIKYHVSISKDTKGSTTNFNWELTLILPLDVFSFHQLPSLKGINCCTNFFKCGDSLPQPHFLSWTPINSPVPNFHLPDFFGKLQFI